MATRLVKKYQATRNYKSNKEAYTVLIVNPNSCSGLTGKNWDSLYESIQGILGKNLKVVLSKKAGDGTTLARNFLKQGFKTIMAIGGDGTINEVANGFFETLPEGKTRVSRLGSKTARSETLKPINSDAILGIVPCGTRNVLAKSLDLPEGVVECCRQFVGGKPKKIDVIVATATNLEDGLPTLPRVFLNAAEMGVGAEIAIRSKKIRKEVNNRILSTAASIIATVPSYQSNLCELSIDNGRRKIETKMTMGVVANGRFIAGGLMAAPDADVSDGLLDLLIVKNSGSLVILNKLADIITGNLTDNDDITYTKARKVSIMSKERDVTVTIDGEPIGKLPATFQSIKHGLTIQV